MLIQAKTAAESAYLVAPGRGITTSDGTIIFPCYSYNGSADSQVSSFIYSKDNGVTWTRSSGIKNTWSSENELVELSDGTLRCFFRNGNSQIYDLDIQNYITISFDDLVNVIDEIGGVTVFISEEEAAYYRENGMPDIQAGDVTLTGSQALAHARNRTLGNDFERTRRQRSVMYGIYRKIMEKKDPSALLPLINYAVNHVKTNMSVSEMYSMAKDVLSVDDLKMQQTCIPQDGTYTDITYEGMQVLKVDFDANKKKIEQLLY